MSNRRTDLERIECLDVVRGVAVCGLVPMNILDFGPDTELTFSPAGLAGPEVVVWQCLMIFGSGKFMSLFSLLFGAGIILSNASSDQEGISAAPRYLPRLGWLWFFGMIHAYLFWHGDILVTYAVTGFVLFWCRKWSPKAMVVAGILMLWAISFLLLLAAVFLSFTDLGKVESWTEIESSLAEDASQDLEALRGSFLDQIPYRAYITLVVHLFGIPFALFWLAGALMFLGMALMKSGYFQNQWRPSSYRKVAWMATPVGIVVGGVGSIMAFASTKSIGSALFWFQLAYWATPVLAMGYCTFLVMWCYRRREGRIRNLLRYAGRMALSNYLGQSVLFGAIFYGHGLGLKGELSFFQILAIIPAIWAIQLGVSTIWMTRFRYGPMEWLWRSLTYGKRFPMKN